MHWPLGLTMQDVLAVTYIWKLDTLQNLNLELYLCGEHVNITSKGYHSVLFELQVSLIMPRMLATTYSLF